MIESGATVRLHASGVEYTVGGELGKGGQGTVFTVQPAGTAGQALALKWYRNAAATAGQLDRLRRILHVDRPSAEFLWPLDLVGADTQPGFGYVMPIRAASLMPMTRVLNGAASMGLREQCTAGAHLASAFLSLHALGLCYADVSVNNVFLDPATGRIEVCDNDNVTIDGERSDVLGTPYFMAPEIIRGEASPSSATDRHSLAIILFMLLARAHPLFGARESSTPVLDSPSLSRLLGYEPLFMFDPEDPSNRPLADLHGNAILLWPMLPRFAQRLFTEAFTTGLTDPAHGRVTETAWRSAMIRLRGLVRVCPRCGAEQFYDPEAPDRVCVADDCGVALPLPSALLEGRHPVLLEPGTTLRRADIAGLRSSTEDPIVADVVAHPANGSLALRNRSVTAWELHRDGSVAEIAPRAAFVLRDGYRITVEGVDARVTVTSAQRNAG